MRDAGLAVCMNSDDPAYFGGYLTGDLRQVMRSGYMNSEDRRRSWDRLVMEGGQEMKRPLGLTIIAWLAIVGGALQILGSLGLVGFGAFGMLIGSTGLITTSALVATGFPMWTGVALMAFGAISVVFGYGAMVERPWSWTMGIVLYALNLFAGFALLALTGVGVTMLFVLLMSAVIFGYLFTPEVRTALGHEPHGHVPTQTPHAV